MKTLMPDFNLLESEKTPDYSPHVPSARLPLHIRERGRELVAVHTTRKCFGEMATLVHTSTDVFKKSAPARGIETIEVDDADLVLTDDADWGEIPSKASSPVQLHITQVERGQIEPIEIDDADFLWNALDSQAIGINAPLETHEIEVTIGEVRQGKPRAVAMDELDWEFLDFD